MNESVWQQLQDAIADNIKTKRHLHLGPLGHLHVVPPRRPYREPEGSAKTLWCEHCRRHHRGLDDPKEPNCCPKCGTFPYPYTRLDGSLGPSTFKGENHGK